MLMLLLLAAVSPPDGKTMAMDDWHTLTIVSVGQAAKGPYYLDVHAGDLDGDGLPDDAYLKLVCSDGKLRQASYEVKPRDSASGMASGKRMHKPLTVVKEWGAASPQLMALKPTYDVKSLKGNERVAGESWTELSLANTDGLCGAAEAAAAAVIKTKTKSNQSND
jgi:hypothetical protein